jgi:hypothetical protein
MTAGVLALSLMAAGFASPLSGGPDNADIVLRPVKYHELGKLIRGLKGKVVIVDFWAEY